MDYLVVAVVVEFMDGETRTYDQVGGFVPSPLVSDGEKLLDMTFKGGAGAPLSHVACVPLDHVRQWRVEPRR